MWKRLNHPNLVPTLGAGPDIAELCVVSPWLSDGHLLQYVKNYPGVNRVAIVRIYFFIPANLLNSTPTRRSGLQMGFPIFTTMMPFTGT